MYKYFIRFTTVIVPPLGTPYLEYEDIQVNPINTIIFKGEKIGDDEFAMIQNINEITFKGDDFKVLKSHEDDKEIIEPSFYIKCGSKEIFRGDFTLRNSVKWCECEVTLTIKTTSPLTNLIDNWEKEINVLNSFYTTKYVLDVNGTLEIKNAIKFVDLVSTLATNTSELIDSFQSDYFDNNTVYDNSYFVSVSDLVNYHKITESATVRIFTFKQIYEYLKDNLDLRLFVEGSTLRLEHISYFLDNNIEAESVVNNSCYQVNIPLNKVVKRFPDTTSGKLSQTMQYSTDSISGLGTFTLIPYNIYGSSSDVDVSFICSNSYSYIQEVRIGNDPIVGTGDFPIINDDFDFAIVTTNNSNVVSPFADGVFIGYESYDLTKWIKLTTENLDLDVLPSSIAIDIDNVRRYLKIENNKACLGSCFDVKDNLFVENRLKSKGEVFDLESYEINLRDKTITYSGLK